MPKTDKVNILWTDSCNQRNLGSLDVLGFSCADRNLGFFHAITLQSTYCMNHPNLMSQGRDEKDPRGRDRNFGHIEPLI